MLIDSRLPLMFWLPTVLFSVSVLTKGFLTDLLYQFLNTIVLDSCIAFFQHGPLLSINMQV